jgi:hypothetical protein
MLILSSNFLNEKRYHHDLTLLENKDKIHLLFILFIQIIDKESKQLISSNKKVVPIFCKMTIKAK